MALICPICMDDLIGINNTVTTECGHQFHATCLMQNIAHNGFSCPYCRNVMIEDISETETEIDEDDNEDDNEDDDNTTIDSSMVGLSDNEYMYNLTLVCVRNLFVDNEEERINRPPPVEWITQKMIERGFTLDRFVKAILMDYDDYNDIEEECLEEADIIYEHILHIVEDYKANTNS